MHSSFGFRIYDMCDNFFLAAFSLKKEKERCILNSPWTSGNSLVVMADYDGSLQPMKVLLHHASFWIRIYD